MKGQKLSDQHKLNMALGRQQARLRRIEERQRRAEQGRDYFDIVGGDPAQRAESAPNIADVVTGAVTAAQGTNAAEIAAAVAAAVAKVFTQHAPPPSPNGPKTVPPEIQRRRNEARERMEVLLDDVRRGTRETPVYDLTADFYDGWKYIEANVTHKTPDGLTVTRPARIRHKGEPNESMVPVNEIAREISAAYMEYIGGKTPDLAEQSYNAYRDRPRYDQGAQVLSPTEKPIFPGGHMAERAQMAQERGAEVIMNPPEEDIIYTGPPAVMTNLKANETRY